jgi:hypothetical protein
LPTNGRSLGALVAMSAGYVAIAAVYAVVERPFVVEDVPSGL